MSYKDRSLAVKQVNFRSYYCYNEILHYVRSTGQRRDALLGIRLIKQRSDIVIITYLWQVEFNILILVNVYLKNHQALTSHKQSI